MSEAATEPPGALERARRLFSPTAAAAFAERGPTEAGYLDLLDDQISSTGAVQEMMESRLVPAIYERYWRPALARVFKGATGPGMAEEVRIARLLLALGEGDKVLDVACGPGNFSREFGRAVGSAGLVVGIDASRNMLERGAAENERTGPGNVALVRADATAMPFADGGFDAVCCFAALHLFADPFAALDEMRRVLDDRGRIAVMTSVRRQLAPRPLKPVLERFAGGMRIFEPDEIVEALQERGFGGVHQRLAGMVQFVGGRLG